MTSCFYRNRGSPLGPLAALTDIVYRRNKRYRLGGALTHFPVSDTSARMGRPPLNVKPTLVRLPDDVRERIVALIGPNKMAAFIREAVEKELVARERDVRLSGPSGDKNDSD